LPATRWPLTNVPVRLPASVTVNRRSAVSIQAWMRETVASSRTTWLLGRRPIRTRPLRLAPSTVPLCSTIRIAMRDEWNRPAAGRNRGPAVRGRAKATGRLASLLYPDRQLREGPASPGRAGPAFSAPCAVAERSPPGAEPGAGVDFSGV
jgi:hypothetical protein